jgi:hypothetical protein
MNKRINILGINIPLMLIVLLSAFAAVTVFTAVEQAAKGAELVYLETKVNNLVTENKELSTKLVRDSALSKVSDEASGSGLTKPEKIMYLTNEAQVAARLQ